jgi:hypothetical protein
MDDGPVHLDAPWTGYLTPASELEECELGDRVCDHLVMWDLLLSYSTLEDRIQCGVRKLAGEVAEATSWIGLPFPSEWWPPSAGEQPPLTIE